jgi:hypothetical protein
MPYRSRRLWPKEKYVKLSDQIQLLCNQRREFKLTYAFYDITIVGFYSGSMYL